MAMISSMGAPAIGKERALTRGEKFDIRFLPPSGLTNIKTMVRR
jgi:hypothetical protein